MPWWKWIKWRLHKWHQGLKNEKHEKIRLEKSDILKHKEMTDKVNNVLMTFKMHKNDI